MKKQYWMLALAVVSISGGLVANEEKREDVATSECSCPCEQQEPVAVEPTTETAVEAPAENSAPVSTEEQAS